MGDGEQSGQREGKKGETVGEIVNNRGKKEANCREREAQSRT